MSSHPSPPSSRKEGVRRTANLLLSALAAMTLVAAPAGAASSNVSIQNYSFQPMTITISVGDTVTWHNLDTVTHTASGDGFNSGNLASGQSYSHTFGQAGSFNYQCNIHNFMKGTVT